MKAEDYNPKAREAFAKSLIDTGVAIFKGIVLLVTVIPLVAISKSAFDGNLASISLYDILSGLSLPTKLLIWGLLIFSFWAAFYFRKEGLRHLHELEEDI